MLSRVFEIIVATVCIILYVGILLLSIFGVLIFIYLNQPSSLLICLAGLGSFILYGIIVYKGITYKTPEGYEEDPGVIGFGIRPITKPVTTCPHYNIETQSCVLNKVVSTDIIPETLNNVDD